ncbi:MAG: Uma2 family endonuclease [Gammaproteobacteria bacterium]
MVTTWRHNLIAVGLRDVIKPQLEPACRVFVADFGLRLGKSERSNKAYPDVMVVCNPKPETYQSSAVLVAEVLSDNSVGRDGDKKFKAYTVQDTVQSL